MYHQENNSIQRHSTTNWILIYHCLKSKTACVQEENVSSTCQIVSWFSKTNKYQSERAWSTIRNCICKIKSVFMVLGWLVWHQLMINVEVISIRTTFVPQKQTAAPSNVWLEASHGLACWQTQSKNILLEKRSDKVPIIRKFLQINSMNEGPSFHRIQKVGPSNLISKFSMRSCYFAGVCVVGRGGGVREKHLTQISNVKSTFPKKFFLVCVRVEGWDRGGGANHSTLKEITKILSEYNFRCSGIISTTNQ